MRTFCGVRAAGYVRRYAGQKTNQADNGGGAGATWTRAKKTGEKKTPWNCEDGYRAVVRFRSSAVRPVSCREAV